jgi:hypothetical protein
MKRFERWFCRYFASVVFRVGLSVASAERHDFEALKMRHFPYEVATGQKINRKIDGSHPLGQFREIETKDEGIRKDEGILKDGLARPFPGLVQRRGVQSRDTFRDVVCMVPQLNSKVFSDAGIAGSLLPGVV